MVHRNKKILIAFLVVVAVFILFLILALFLSQNNSSPLLATNKIYSLSKEDSLSKYPFNMSTSIGIRKAINTDNKLDIWGLFEKAENGKLSVKIGEDVLTFPLPANIRVLQGTNDPNNYKYLGFSEIKPGTKLVVTVLEQNSGSEKYVVDFVQLPIMP